MCYLSFLHEIRFIISFTISAAPLVKTNIFLSVICKMSLLNKLVLIILLHHNALGCDTGWYEVFNRDLCVKEFSEEISWFKAKYRCIFNGAKLLEQLDLLDDLDLGGKIDYLFNTKKATTNY